MFGSTKHIHMKTDSHRHTALKLSNEQTMQRSRSKAPKEQDTVLGGGIRPSGRTDMGEGVKCPALVSICFAGLGIRALHMLASAPSTRSYRLGVKLSS